MISIACLRKTVQSYNFITLKGRQKNNYFFSSKIFLKSGLKGSASTSTGVWAMG